MIDGRIRTRLLAGVVFLAATLPLASGADNASMTTRKPKPSSTPDDRAAELQGQRRWHASPDLRFWVARGVNGWGNMERYIKRVDARWELLGQSQNLARHRGEGLARLDLIDRTLWARVGGRLERRPVRGSDHDAGGTCERASAPLR